MISFSLIQHLVKSKKIKDIQKMELFMNMWCWGMPVIFASLVMILDMGGQVRHCLTIFLPCIFSQTHNNWHSFHGIQSTINVGTVMVLDSQGIRTMEVSLLLSHSRHHFCLQRHCLCIHHHLRLEISTQDQTIQQGFTQFGEESD